MPYSWCRTIRRNVLPERGNDATHTITGVRLRRPSIRFPPRARQSENTAMCRGHSAMPRQAGESSLAQ